MMAKKPITKPEVIAPIKPTRQAEAAALLERLNASSKNIDTILGNYEAGTKPLTRVQQAAAVAEDKAVATQAARDARLASTNLAASNVSNVPTTTLKTEAQIAAEAATAARQAERQSAYDLLYSQFAQYGLASLVDPLKGLIISGASPAEFTIRLRESEPYQKRFAANKQRIANGFKAIDEATYLALEDKYQSIMQNYGLPASYYTKGEMGTQPGFEKFIAGNVDPVTLEERIMEGVKINKGSKTLIDTAKEFYPNLTDGDFLAYTLDPKNSLSDIKRKVTAIEIGGAAVQSGLQTNVTRAEELGTAGITGVQAAQGYSTIGSGLQRGSQLASIYGQDPYTQTTAEQEVFKLSGQTEAEKQRKKVTGLEKATFGGGTGLTAGALARDRAGGY
jgi:hypothetical protein